MTIKTTIGTNNGSDIQIVGTVAADTLDGGIKATPFAFFTELYGGGGNDTYYIDAFTGTPDKVVELPNAGTDTVVLVNTWNGVSGYWVGATSYTLSDNVENLSVLGTPINSTLPGGKQIDTTFQGMTIYGNALNNVIITGSGSDDIYGGAGNDVMQGGAGADNYYVDALGDKVIEGTDPYFLPGPPAGVGNQVDTVFSMVNFTLGSGLENLNLDFSSGNTTGTGNALSNQIFGSAGNNTLSGLAGNDFMYGGGGKDTLLGGDGNDYLVGDNKSWQTNYFNHLGPLTSVAVTVFGGDVLDGGNGNDTLAGADGDKLKGGAGNDVLYGNATTLPAPAPSGPLTPNEKISMDGGAGDDQFMNFGIADTIIGGTGTDTVFIDFGPVSVNYTLGADVERAILMNGATTADTLTGNALANYLQGNAGGDALTGNAGDDVLDGGTGADTMIGGAGSDNYMVDNIGDVVVETTVVGGDNVFSYIASYTLGANVENLVLEEGTYTGTLPGVSVNGKGNALNNLIIGNSRTNLLEGAAGNDTLDGGTGKDTLIGGAGNDVYVVDNSGDTIQELADYTTTPPGGLLTTVVGGLDSVILVNDNTTAGAHFFNGTSFTMARNVEKLDASAVTLAGSLLAPVATSFTITGNESANTIIGSRLNDTIIGGAGNDTMNGGAGSDTYYVTEKADSVSETIAGVAGGVDTIMYSASNPGGTFTLGANIENLNILGGSGKIVGNALDNVITGNGADNVIDGGAGNNTLYGNFGNDSLIGGAGNDILDGGAGNDTMNGGGGNDTYVVDSGDGFFIGDVITDSGGTADTVQSNVTTYVLGAGIENLTLMANAVNGTGNSANNKITGNTSNNVLDGAGGNDTLDGGLGNDIMIGGSGDDTFNVDNAGDIVREDSVAGGGLKDTVISTISYSLADTDGSGAADTLGGGVENLTLASTLSGGAAAFNATGNAFNNTIIGNENNNLIDGGSTTVVGGTGGLDTMTGGDGNDTYFVDNIGDKIIELSSVVAPVSGPQLLATVGNADGIYATLADASTFNMTTNALNVERLHILDNTDATVGVNNTVNVIGNASDNIIWGGVGVNSIDGGDGNDIITGGDDNDTLLGGKGDDVLNGDGLYQDAYNGPWTNASGGFDSMNGGDGNDTLYVDIGDGAGTLFLTPEDSVVGGLGIDTVKLVSNTIADYTLNTDVENLDLNGLTTAGAVNVIGNAAANTITGMAGAIYQEVLSGGDGNDSFVLTPTSGANDTVRGGLEFGTGGATSTSDTSKADSIFAKVDTTGGAVVANIDMKQIEAVTLDVSNMATTANGFIWNFTGFGDVSNFTQAPSAALGNVAPLVTITGGVTLPPDTTATTVTGDITLNNLGVFRPVTYVLTNYGQANGLAVTTTLGFADATGGADNLHVVLDNHKSGGLTAVGIETLFVVSTGDVMNSAALNALDVSAVTATAGPMAAIDVTGDSSVQLRGLANNGNITLHDFAAQTFNMNAAGATENLNLNNVETRLVSNGTLTTLNLAVTNSTIGSIGSVIDASGLNNATSTFAVSGTGNLTLNNLRGGTLTMSGDGVSTTAEELQVNAIGGVALNLTASDGNVTVNVSGTARNDSYIFGNSLNNFDNITDVGGTDTLTATLDNLDATSTGQLHIAGVETFTFTQTAADTIGGGASIDAQFITGATSVTASGGVIGQKLTMNNLAAATVTGTGAFLGDLVLNLTDGVNHTVTGGAGSDIIVSGNGDDIVTISAGAGDDNIMTGAGGDIVITGATLNNLDTIDGGGGTDVLTYADSALASDDLLNVSNMETITLTNTVVNAAETTLDALVAAGAALTVNASSLTTGTLTWNGSAETDGVFSVVGGAAADTITTGAGNDTISGSNGADIILAGDGDDLVVMAISAGNIDDIGAGLGNDTLQLTGTPAGAVIIDLSSIVDQIVSVNAVLDAPIQLGFENFTAFGMGGASALTVTAVTTGSSIVGGGGADTLIGGTGNDIFNGGNGTDSITGGSGDDTLDGGVGIDTITGDAGNDTILWDKAAADVLDGGADTDTLVLVTTTTGNITVDLTQVVDQVSTSGSNQTGFENIDASVLTTGILTATAAATGSVIIGGGANDTITGGASVDVLTGNGGADHFVFNATPVAGNIDTITDFAVGTDKIDLAHSAFEMITTTAGSTLSTSEFAAGAGLQSSTTAGTVMVYNTSTGNLYYDADANGAGVGLLFAHLDGTPALTAGDINII